MEAGAELILTDLPRLLLEASVLLLVAVLVGLFTRRVHIPLTVVLAAAGLLVSELGTDLVITQLIMGEGFENLVLNLFLPVLIFEAALMLSTREFMRNLVPIGALATVAVVISAALVGVSMQWAIGLSMSVALLFGVIISATDPVAVVSVFREVGVSNRLLTLVEGESMLNDGVAIVLSQILVLAALGETLSAGEGVVDFVSVFFGGTLIGALIGVVAVLLLPLLGRLPAAAMSIAVAYGSFVLADEVLGFSGVMATVAAGIIVGSMTESRADRAVREILRELWDALAFVANALLFLFIGLALDFSQLAENLEAILVAVAAVLVARPLAVVPLVWILERMHVVPGVGARSSAVLVWGGLRGGVALALALALPAEVPARETIVAATGGVVLATLLVNATTIKTLVHILGLDRVSRTDQFLGAAARLFAIDETRRRLAGLDVSDEVLEAHLAVAEVDARDDLRRSDLDESEKRHVLILRGLHIERETYQNLSDAGLLPPIATRTLIYEIDDEIEEAEEGALRTDAARRAHLPWYARMHRALLGLLPPPLGEDLTEVGYIEVSARRLAAQRAADELESFKSLPDIDPDKIVEAKKTFTDWERSAQDRLHLLEERGDLEHGDLHRRQARALGRITVRDALVDLVDIGVVSSDVAEDAARRIVTEIGET
jgi:monovalent cation:H+ antiporter, CPA1 family